MLLHTSKNRGLLLVTGGAGTGKTTTLAAMVNHINKTRCCHIVTIEDPIEYLHRHEKSIVAQKEIGADILDIQTALRWVSKSDPDVIMLNEMPRDADALRLGLALAEDKLLLASITTTEPHQVIDCLVGSENLSMRQLDLIKYRPLSD